MRTLQLVNQSSVRMPRKFLQSWVARLENLLKSQGAQNLSVFKSEVSLVFLNPQEARRLNNKYRGKNYATDVLSFGLEPGGELILCPQVIQRQAREHGLSFRAELGYMVLHGFLHLMGYEHEASKLQAQKMFDIQDKVFAKAAQRYGF